ncbi:MAG: UDP-glucose/GDP-mannose dehydrogenase family protein [Candidatus Latescibacterota bacterium]|nr:MAG: UDP-glucose/GDP-mannose dehydrogenase family protein [Candidatus Latescibacterota bacterium]
MKVALFGLGYVGCVSAGCFARAGHDVYGVDVNPVKVEILRSGKSPIVEKDVGELIAAAVEAGRLHATTSASEAVHATQVSLICVGTPSHPNGSLDLRYIYRVAEEIGAALRHRDAYHVVVIRSTVMPGTAAEVARILETQTGRKQGEGFGVVVNPEFLREGSAVSDFVEPPFTLLGGEHERALDVVAQLYADVDAPIVRAETRVAEMVKYANNVYHAAKITFANEVGNVCKALGIDSHKVMEIFCMDEKLNVSAAYLKPGFAFGGSCLPKDLRALTFRAKDLDIPVPMLESLIASNALQIRRVVDQLLRWKARKLGFLGLSFKGGTDDLRESPIVEVVETMIGKGYDVRIYDANVSLARLFGANKEYIEKEIPHIERLMCKTMDEVLEHADVIVIGNRSSEFAAALGRLRPEQRALDLVRLLDEPPESERYEGICW